jgi:hypothetical protein
MHVKSQSNDAIPIPSNASKAKKGNDWLLDSGLQKDQ